MNTHLASLLIILLPLTIGRSAERLRETNTVVQVFAGSGIPGFLDGKGAETFFSNPRSLALSKGVLWVWDVGTRRMRKILPDGTVSSFPAELFGDVYGLASMSDGAVAIAERYRVSKAYPDGQKILIAGNSESGYADGVATSARFGFQLTLAVGPNDVIYVAEQNDQRIRKIEGGIVTTFAGAGVRGSQDGRGIFSTFDEPAGIAVNLAGDVFVTQNTDKGFRKITSDGFVTTIEGFVGAVGLNAFLYCLPDGSILCAGRQDAILRLRPDGSESVLGGGEGGLFRGVGGVVFDGTDTYYVSDAVGHRIYKITVPKEAPIPPSSLSVGSFAGVTIQGTVGRSYRIEATGDLALETGWAELARIILPKSPHLWIDEDSPKNQKRFYRAVLLP